MAFTITTSCSYCGQLRPEGVTFHNPNDSVTCLCDRCYQKTLSASVPASEMHSGTPLCRTSCAACGTWLGATIAAVSNT